MPAAVGVLTVLAIAIKGVMVVLAVSIVVVVVTLTERLRERRLDWRIYKAYWIERRMAERDHFVSLGRRAVALGQPRAPRRSDYRSDWEYAFAVHRLLVGEGVPYGLDLVMDKRLGRQVFEDNGLRHLAIQLRHDAHSTAAYLCDPDRLAPEPRWERDARRVNCLTCVARNP